MTDNPRFRILTAIDELVLLLPAIPAAMAKDNAKDGRGSQGPIVSGMPVNADVISAADTIRRGVRDITGLCRAVLGDGPREWEGVAKAVKSLDPYSERLQAGRKTETLERVADAVDDWRRLIRAALGLHQPSTRLGYNCPHHPSEPTPLVVLGGEGKLVRESHGWTCAWTYAEAVFCPGCRVRWTRPQWPLLGKMLDTPEGQAA